MVNPTFGECSLLRKQQRYSILLVQLNLRKPAMETANSIICTIIAITVLYGVAQVVNYVFFSD